MIFRGAYIDGAGNLFHTGGKNHKKQKMDTTGSIETDNRLNPSIEIGLNSARLDVRLDVWVFFPERYVPGGLWKGEIIKGMFVTKQRAVLD